MDKLAEKVIFGLKGKTLATAESCTGGMIGQLLTSVPGSSLVYKGGIISYTNEVKSKLLSVSEDILQEYGAVSAPVACQMAQGVREALSCDVAVSVTGLAGPGGDDRGNPVGTVFIGLSDKQETVSRVFHFAGTREEIRRQSAGEALRWILSRYCE